MDPAPQSVHARSDPHTDSTLLLVHFEKDPLLRDCPFRIHFIPPFDLADNVPRIFKVFVRLREVQGVKDWPQ